MDDEKHRALSDGPDRYPSLFFSNAIVPQRQSMRIVEDQNCGFKSDIMFAQVPAVLVFVPFEPHHRSRPTIKSTAAPFVLSIQMYVQSPNGAYDSTEMNVFNFSLDNLRLSDLS